MKRIIIFSTLALCLVGCSKDLDCYDGLTENYTLTAVRTQFDDATKTHMSGNDIVWAEGDQIEVCNESGFHSTFVLTAGAGTVSGTFEGTMSGSPVAAYYPADKFISFSTGGGFTSTFPDVQIYDASGIVDNGTIPMTGVVNDNVISFKNACGLIKLSLKGEGKVTSVVISDLYNPIAGDLSFATDGTLNSAVNGLHKVKLMCTSPVSLSAGATSDFYIALPSGALSNGFCAEIMNEKGHPAEVFFTSQSNTIVRSACTPMPEKSGLVMSIPTGYTEYTCLKQNGTVPYINTGITVSDDFAVNATMFISDYSSFNTPIGARQTSKYFYVGRYSDTKGWSFWSGVGNSEPTRLYSGDNYGNGIVEYNNLFSGTSGKHLLRGNLYETQVNSSELPTNKIYLFAANRCTAASGEGVAAYSTKDCRFYYCTFIKGGSVVRNFIPCTADEAGTDANGKSYMAGAAGFYDKVEGKFYSNAAASGTFDAVNEQMPVAMKSSGEFYSSSAQKIW